MNTTAQARVGPVPTHSFAPVRSNLLQRRCACGGTPGPDGECAECRRKRLVRQARATTQSEPSEVPPVVHEVVRSPGQPLDLATRAFMEPSFGHDFGRVRVHTDAKAAESAHEVNALAYTVGRDVVFGARQYAPRSFAGKKLIAHELTHVVQQSQSLGSLQPASAISQPTEFAEVEAEKTAARVVAGLAPGGITPLAAGSIQRQEIEVKQDEPARKAPTRPEEIRLSHTSPGEVIGTSPPPVLSLYNFGIDRAELKKEHQVALAEVVDLLKRARGDELRLVVIGHTDSSGTPTVNQSLSKQRALAVQKILQRSSSIGVYAAWAGEQNAVESNDTAEGRTRNRRVDIHFLPVRTVPTPKVGEQTPEQEQPKKDEPPKKEDRPPKKEEPPKREDDRSWCEKHPVICGAFGVGVGVGVAVGVGTGIGVPGGLLACLLNPLGCLPDLPDLDGDDDHSEPEDKDKDKEKEKEKEEEKPRKRKACSLTVDLPERKKVAVPDGSASLRFPFQMRLTFQQESPKSPSYCDCNCGEYRQYVRGYFNHDDGTGVLKAWPHLLPNGNLLDPNNFQEDGQYSYSRGTAPGQRAYGHRYEYDQARRIIKPAAKKFLAQDLDTDRFVDPDRQDGCTYEGSDKPGFDGGPNEEFHFHLWFRGGPVDACNGAAKIGQWREWEVVGDRVPPKPPSKKQEPTPTPKPGRRNTPRPYSGPITGNDIPARYAGGLPDVPTVGRIYTVTLAFESQGQTFYAPLQLSVIEIDEKKERLELISMNTTPLDIAPEGHTPIVVRPGHPAVIYLSEVWRINNRGMWRGGVP